MKNVTLFYKGHLTKVKTAVSKANEILATKQFYTMIRGYKQFDSSELSPDTISKLMEDSGQRIEVKVNWIWPVPQTRHNKITLSAWDFSSCVDRGVNNLIHETVLSMNCLHGIINHKPEPPDHLSLTAPWVIGSIAETLIAKNN